MEEIFFCGYNSSCLMGSILNTRDVTDCPTRVHRNFRELESVLAPGESHIRFIRTTFYARSVLKYKL